MATTPFLHGGAAATAGEQKQRGDGLAKNGLSPARGKQRGRKGVPKSQAPKKRGMGVYQLEQLIHRDEWKKRLSGDQGAAVAAASSSALVPFHDHRLQNPPPSFLDPLTGTPVHYSPSWQQQVVVSGADSHHFRLNQPAILGASSGGRGGGMVAPYNQAAVVPYNNPSCNCNGFFKKKRTETYELPEKSPVTGYIHCSGPTYTPPPNQVGSTFDDQVAACRNILESSALLGRRICTEYEFFPQKLTQNHHTTQGDHHHGSVGEAIDLSLRL